MATGIHTSVFPKVPIKERSIFTHLFFSTPSDSSLVGGYPGSYPAYIDSQTGTTITRAQAKYLCLSFAYGLLHHPRLAPISLARGSTVLVFSPNSLAWPVVLLGSVAAGLRCTLANSAYTSRELGHQYVDSGASLIYTVEEGLPIVRDMLKDLGLEKADADRRIVLLPSSLKWAGGPDVEVKVGKELLKMEELLGMGTLPQEELFTGEEVNETVYLCYSSGTTGKPKGVETTHLNLTSVLDMVRDVFVPLTPGEDSMLAVLPFFHVYGAAKLVHYPLMRGISTVIMPRFDPIQFCANIEKYKCTVSLIVPPVLLALTRHPAVDQYDLSSMKTLYSGAAPLSAALVTQVRNRLLSKRKPGQNMTCHITQGFGLTETSPTTHLLPVQDSVRKVGSVGLLIPNLELRIVEDSENGGVIDVKDGEPGEVWVRGPSIMKGYLNNPTATADAITPDRWFRTGDIGFRDAEGYYYIVDRRKELIKYKGFQVPPAELEGVLLTHPDIADAAVIGIDSAKDATELPRAYVVHAHPERVPTGSAEAKAFGESVQVWFEQRVAKHKFLRGGVIVIDVVPKSAAGKILRRELRNLAKQELADKNTTIKAKL